VVFGRQFIKRLALCYRTVVCLSCLSVLSVCNVGVLSPNGWMDQDETWRSDRPRPWSHCVGWPPSSPFLKGAQSPIFGPYLLWPNGWMYQDATWWEGRPRPKRHCVRWGPTSLPKKGAEPPPIFGTCLFQPNGGRIKMPLCMEVGLGPGHIVLDRDPAPPKKRT